MKYLTYLLVLSYHVIILLFVGLTWAANYWQIFLLVTSVFFITWFFRNIVEENK